MREYTLESHDAGSGSRSYTAQTAPRPLLARLWLLTVLPWLALVALGWFWCSVAVLPLFVLFRVRSVETTETLTLLPSLGIQLSHTNRRTLPPLSTSRSTRFLPLERIRKVVINEGLQGAGGTAYLAIVERTEGERDKVHVVFPSILPQLSDLQPVWKSAQALLAS